MVVATATVVVGTAVVVLGNVTPVHARIQTVVTEHAMIWDMCFKIKISERTFASAAALIPRIR